MCFWCFDCAPPLRIASAVAFAILDVINVVYLLFVSVPACYCEAQLTMCFKTKLEKACKTLYGCMRLVGDFQRPDEVAEGPCKREGQWQCLHVCILCIVWWIRKQTVVARVMVCWNRSETRLKIDETRGKRWNSYRALKVFFEDVFRCTWASSLQIIQDWQL